VTAKFNFVKYLNVIVLLNNDIYPLDSHPLRIVFCFRKYFEMCVMDFEIYVMDFEIGAQNFENCVIIVYGLILCRQTD
jgi:hypothetical protein